MHRSRWLTTAGWLLAAGCGGGGGDVTGPPSGGNSNRVTVGNNFFSPSELSVPAGTAVTWAWADNAATHNVTFDAGAPNSGSQSSGTFTRTFGSAGTFTYHCTIHGPAMHGTVTVTSTGGSGAGGTGGTGGGGGGGMGGGGYGY